MVERERERKKKRGEEENWNREKGWKIKEEKRHEYKIQNHEKKRESMTRNNLVPSLIKWSLHSLPTFLFIISIVKSNMSWLTGNRCPQQMHLLKCYEFVAVCLSLLLFPFTVFKLVGKKNAKGPFDETQHTVPIDPIDRRKIIGKKIEF